MISYALAAERARHRLYSLSVTCACPVCDQPVQCRVKGEDVTVADCAGDCGGRAREDWLAENARDRAEAEREALAEHYLEGGQ